MLFFLRKIRNSLLSKKQYTTYLIYAIGEILLVVIGILIAVQIDDWQKDVFLRKQEKQYLTEIKSNLQDDIGLCNYTSSFNDNKTKVILEILALFKLEDEDQITAQMLPHMDLLFAFATLSQNRVAFDNMNNAQSIAIIKNVDLRSKLSAYYSKSFVSASWTIHFTRKLNDQLTPLIMSQDMTKQLFNIDVPIERPSDHIPYYRNPYVISTLVNTVKNISFQTIDANQQEEEARDLINSIDSHLTDWCNH